MMRTVWLLLAVFNTARLSAFAFFVQYSSVCPNFARKRPTSLPDFSSLSRKKAQPNHHGVKRLFSTLPSSEAAQKKKKLDMGMDEEFDRVLHRMKKLAKATSRDETAVEQAQTLLQEFLSSPGASTTPSASLIELYNTLWEAHAYASHLGATGGDMIAIQIRELLLDKTNDDDHVVRPNIKSYATLMDAYTQRSNLQSVQAVVDLLKNQPDPALQPDITIYNRLMRAYSVLGHADKARTLLQQLLDDSSDSVMDQDEEQATPLRPNHKTWFHFLRALAKEGNADEVEHYMQTVMMPGYQHHGYADWKPTVHSYNAWMRAMINNNRNRNDQQEETMLLPLYQQVTGILHDMIRLHQEEGEQLDTVEGGIRPNAETFLLAIQSFRGATGATIPNQIERILELQRALVQRNDDDALLVVVVADMETRTYNTAISIVARTRDPQKAICAQRLANFMLTTTTSNEPSLVTYRNVLNACAYTRGSAQDRLAAFQVAIAVFNQVRDNLAETTTKDSGAGDDSDDDDQHPGNSEQDDKVIMVAIHHLFLQACFKLMAPSAKRDLVVFQAVSKCRQDGYLSERILDYVMKQSSEEVESKICRDFVGSRPPEEWSRNVPVQL